MKKTVALIMALALVLCSFSALAAHEKDAYTWAKALPDGATFMFDYSCMQPVQAVKIKNGYGFYDLVTTSGEKKVVTDPADPKNAQLKVDPNTGLPYMTDFAHLSKTEIAYYNDRIDSNEYGAIYQKDGKYYLDSTYNGAGGKAPPGTDIYYPVSFDGVYDDAAKDHDYEDQAVVANKLNPAGFDGVETLQPASTTTFVDPVTNKPVTRENDGLEATFTEVPKSKSAPYSLGVEYTYSTTAPDSKAWSDAEKSTLVPVKENGAYKTITDSTGKVMYVYVNKEVSNTPAANVATTTNRTENYISTAFVAGFLPSELNPNGSKDQTRNVVPVDLTADGTYVYPIVTKAHTIVGLVWATVEDGYVTIDGQLRDQVKRYGDDFTLKIYTSVDQLAKKGTAYEIGEAIATEEFGDAIFFEIKGKVQYHWSIGASKAGGYSIYWTLQDYWRYETRWKLYRNSLRDIVDLLAAE